MCPDSPRRSHNDEGSVNPWISEHNNTVNNLLTAREVAERLAVSTETVLRWTRNGILPAFRLPSGALRYEEPALTNWLQQRATGKSSEN